MNTPLPNILLIMPDQMRGDCLSSVGHPILNTPTLDSLAEEGVLFRRAYSTCPSCIPARHAFLTGRHPASTGMVGFEGQRLQTQTLPTTLEKAGYKTVLIGRNMHQLPVDGDCGYAQTRYGSTYKNDDDYDRFLKAKAPHTGGIKKLVHDIGLTYNHWQAAPWPLAENLHPTHWIVDQSQETLDSHSEDSPLFLTTSFYAPHPPLFPPASDFHRHAGRLPLPTAKGKWVDQSTLPPEGDDEGQRVHLQGHALKQAQQGYFGLIEYMDRLLAELIERFKKHSKESGRPWLIIFTSDHGEMLGDHCYFRKCEPYEGSANIPFIITGSPEMNFLTGQHLHTPVCLEDIYATLNALTGQENHDLDGIDLLPLLRGTPTPTERIIHLEHSPCYNEAQAFHALTDGRFKYIWRPFSGDEQLFDLLNDPREEDDLSQSSTANTLIAEWRTRLVNKLISRPEGFVSEGKLQCNRPYPALMKKPL